MVLLSGEGGTIPPAEARALFLAYDPGSRFLQPEERVLLVDSAADPFLVGSRIAFARRVGRLLGEPAEASETVRGRRVRYREFSLPGRRRGEGGTRALTGVDETVDLASPDYEFTFVEGEGSYLALTAPLSMMQGWSRRRPRRRAFFHPSAMFPKLARALVNFSRCRDGDVFLDPFAGTGSIPIEAAVVGARVVALDRSRVMGRGALANMKRLSQDWLGVVRGDAFTAPLRPVDAVATDVPYGRASSTAGLDRDQVLTATASSIPALVRGGGFAVVMHPSSSPLTPAPGTETVEEHRIYVNRSLTRKITVLRRT